MSRNSRLKHTAKKRKKKGPGPGDRPRRVEASTADSIEDSIYRATDVIKEPVKADVVRSQNAAPTTSPVRRAGPRGG
jgi:hypothetical protein